MHLSMRFLFRHLLDRRCIEVSMMHRHNKHIDCENTGLAQMKCRLPQFGLFFFGVLFCLPLFYYAARVASLTLQMLSSQTVCMHFGAFYRFSK